MQRSPSPRSRQARGVPIVVAAVVAWTGLVALCPTAGAVEPSSAPPPTAARPDAARKAIAAIRVPEGFTLGLFAAEPDLRHPVAICLDERGRVYVAEEHRLNRGVEENRTRAFLLDDDLAAESLDDRLRMYRRHADRFAGGMDHFRRHADQVRLLEDHDGDGIADRSTVFAGGFSDPLDGIGAGVIARDGIVWYTCIPNLWRLRDGDGDGVAEERTSLVRGFGVNCAFLGHDLHGLVWGPDGRLYFSVGDRGYDLTTREGRRLHEPRRGAVFRCRPDGSELEVVHRGLRNPQELAFDAYGNLFAADNNCDKGDEARLVHVIDGGDSGWNMSYQSLVEPYAGGPWLAERMWHHGGVAGQPAWIVPSCGRIGTGPSGFLYNGTDLLGPGLRDRFVLANYTGNGGLDSFRVVPRGASFEVRDLSTFLQPLFATDVAFGSDGRLYVSDYGPLDWTGGSDHGRIYALGRTDPAAAEAAGLAPLLAPEAARLPDDRLLELLAHPDMRVRQRAQFALAARGTAVAARLTTRALAAGPTVPRLHALWAVGQIAADDPAAAAAVLGPLAPLLADADPHLRGQAAKLLGEAGHAAVAENLPPLLADADPHVRLHAAIALGRIGGGAAIGPLAEMLRDNDDADPYLRHAAVRGLELVGDAAAIAPLAADPAPAVRLGAVLVWRRLGDRRLLALLDDPVDRVATEAARAASDLQWDDAVGPLADRLVAWTERAMADSDPLLRRGINAAFRRGSEADVAALATAAASPRVSAAIRAEAVGALGDMIGPVNRDRVSGAWRPVPARDAAVVRRVIGPRFLTLLAAATGPLQAAVMHLAARLDIAVDEPTILALLGDDGAPTDSRVAALELLAARGASRLAAATEQALADPEPRLRIAARAVLAATRPDRAVESLAAVLSARGDDRERQQALGTLAGMRRPEADAVLATWLDRLTADDVPAELALDVLEAAASRDAPALRDAAARYRAGLDAESDPLRRHRWSLTGGDAEQGRRIFAGHPQAQCVRCHRAGGPGGDAGPDLSRVAARHDRRGLLESLVAPHARIAAGFGSVSLTLDDGLIVAGVVREETADRLEVVTADGRLVVVNPRRVEERSQPRSPMPEMFPALSRRELRDLVAYLATLE